MSDPLITCPSCKTAIKLTESLAAPLLESTRRQYEERIAQQEAEVRKREAAIREQQRAIATAQESIDEQVAAKYQGPAEQSSALLPFATHIVGNLFQVPRAKH